MNIVAKSLLLLLLTIACVTSAAETVPTGRLPQDVQPLSYNLSLTIVPDQEQFFGTAKILIELRKETSLIWMHGKDLLVKEARIELADGKKPPVKYTQVDESGVARIDLPDKVAPQQATLWFTYEAPFNRKLEGLYRVDEDGRSYAFTQFEAISARRCFPGFDEPAFKTPFHITLTVRKEHEAITNTLPVEEVTLPDGFRKIRFAPTEKLPTYLIAFAVGPFDVVKGVDVPPNEFRKQPLPLRGIAVKGKGEKFGYALANAGSIVTLLEKYFGIGYPFSKLDLIAVPDFEWGAMENAGAITFRDTYLLFDEKDAPYSQKKLYAGVMAHEVGHQWFGNLVTIAWWDDIWLNEGLTSWIDNKIVQSWNPSYKANVDAVQGALRVMDTDSTDSTHPVHRPVKDSNEIASIADGIIFGKGSALPLMFEHYLGSELFQEVIRHYLKKHEFSTVTSQDFLDSLQEVAGKEVATAFRTFLFQPGVPFMDVETTCQDKVAFAGVRQSRYVPLGGKVETKEVWQIPFCVRFKINGTLSDKCTLISEQETMIRLSVTGCPDWVMPNRGGTGYYRWSLSPEEFSRLHEKGRQKLSVQEQLSTVDSVKSAFAGGRVSAGDILMALAPFAGSETPELAMAPAPILKFFRDYLVDPTEQPALENYSRELYRPVYERLGFDSKESDSDDIKQFRREVIEFLAFVAYDPIVRQEATKRGRAYIGFGTDDKIHPESVDPNLVEVALAVTVQESGSDYFDALVSFLKTSNDSLLRLRVLSAVGHATDPAVVQRSLALSLDPALRTNEVPRPLQSLIEQKENWETTWKWLQSNFDPLISRLSLFESGGISLLSSNFCSEEKAAEVKEFLTERVTNLPGGPSYLGRTVNYITLCSAKVKAHRQSANAYFRNYNH